MQKPQYFSKIVSYILFMYSLPMSLCSHTRDLAISRFAFIFLSIKSAPGGNQEEGITTIGPGQKSVRYQEMVGTRTQIWLGKGIFPYLCPYHIDSKKCCLSVYKRQGYWCSKWQTHSLLKLWDAQIAREWKRKEETCIEFYKFYKFHIRLSIKEF